MRSKYGLKHQTKNRKLFTFKGLRFLFVRMKGLEPPRREAPDPKSGAAANYATSAAFIKLDCKDIFLNRIARFFFRSFNDFQD